VVDARFCKPLDTDMLRRLAKEHAVMMTVEEGSIGGFAAHVMQVWLCRSTRARQCTPGCASCMHVSHASLPTISCLLDCPPTLPQFLCLEGLLDGNLKFRPLTLPDRYIEHGTQVGRAGWLCWQVCDQLCASKRCALLLRPFCSFLCCSLQAEQLADAGITASHIAKMALGLGLGKATTLVQ